MRKSVTISGQIACLKVITRGMNFYLIFCTLGSLLSGVPYVKYIHEYIKIRVRITITKFRHLDLEMLCRSGKRYTGV